MYTHGLGPWNPQRSKSHILAQSVPELATPAGTCQESPIERPAPLIHLSDALRLRLSRSRGTNLTGVTESAAYSQNLPRQRSAFPHVRLRLEHPDDCIVIVLARCLPRLQRWEGIVGPRGR